MASYTPSVKSQAQDVIQLLKQSKSSLLIGIWGMIGIGKSTIAQSIYDQVGPYFEHKCFLGNIRGAWGKDFNGQVSLQRKLIFNIYGQEIKIPIYSIKSGCVILKQRLQHKRVFLILDDVDKLEQLKALCGNLDWFGPGSKIIITTRDRHLLKEHGVSNIYPVKELDKSESVDILNWGAFNQATSPPKDFVELSRQLVSYRGGLPLALEALGRFLHGKEILKWKYVLNSLQRFFIPAPTLLEDLEDSLSGLSDEEKHIFFEIACFFDRMNQNDVLQTLNRSTQFAALQRSLLEDKSILTIDENNNLEMHVLLQAMARDIIRRESRYKTDHVS